MTREELERGNKLAEEISTMKDDICYVERNLLRMEGKDADERHPAAQPRQPMLRFCNFFRNRSDEEAGVKTPGAFLFDGDNVYGHEIHPDAGMLRVILDYMQLRMAEKEKAFRDIGKDDKT